MDTLISKVRLIDDAWIVGLGVGHRLKVATSLHCVESALWKENAYYRKLFRQQVCYSYKTATGETGQHCYQRRTGQIYGTVLLRRSTAPVRDGLLLLAKGVVQLGLVGLRWALAALSGGGRPAALQSVKFTEVAGKITWWRLARASRA